MSEAVEKDNVTENCELVNSSKKKKKRRSEKVEQTVSSDLKLNDSNNLEVNTETSEDVKCESKNVGSVNKDKKRKKKRKHEKNEVQVDSQTVKKKKKDSVTVEYCIDDESNADGNIEKIQSKSEEQNDNTMETEASSHTEDPKEETVDETPSKPKEKKDKAERKKKKEKKVKEKETKTEVEEEYKGLSKKRIKHLKHEKNSHQVALDRKARLAIEYLIKWHEDAVNWKFKTLRQTSLIYNCCNPVMLPDKYFDLTLEYLCSIKGLLRNKVLEVANKVKEGDVGIERAKRILAKMNE